MPKKPEEYIDRKAIFVGGQENGKTQTVKEGLHTVYFYKKIKGGLVLKPQFSQKVTYTLIGETPKGVLIYEH